MNPKPRYLYEVSFIDGTVYTIRVVATSAKKAIEEISKRSRRPGLTQWRARKVSFEPVEYR